MPSSTGEERNESLSRSWESRDLRISGVEDLRKYPERPIVAVGAVILDGDRVLLVQRGQEPFGFPTVLKVAAFFVLATLAVLIFRKAWSAIRSPGPRTIQTAVKTAILSLVWLHVGLLLGVRGWFAALIVSLFWFPAITVGRWIYST